MIKVGILTVSDSVANGSRVDLSGPALRSRCVELGWAVVAEESVPDDREAISELLEKWADRDRIALLLTTGGTGVSARDNTPEATRAVIHRDLPGIAELIRMKGLQQTKYSVLSRGLAGTRGQSLIVNLPGAPKGAVYSLSVIEDLIPHSLDLLRGRTEHAASES